MPGFNALQDDFNDGVLNAAIWSASYGPVDETAGRARIPCDTGYSGLKSGFEYTLTSNGISLQLIAPTPSGAATAAASVLVLSATGGTDAGFIVDPAQSAVGLYVREGYSDPGAVFLTFSATDHAWLRFRETAGSLYWDTSADGITWTNRRTATTPAWAAETGLAFLVEGHRDAGTADFVEVDNVNVPPITTHDASASLSATGGLTVAGIRTAVSSATLAADTALAPTGTAVRPAGASLTVNGTLAAAGRRTARASATLTATATLTARTAGSQLDRLTAGTPRTRWSAGTPRT
ncbi:hypothetical protein [Streptomyces sp. NPDC054887]